jgi:hypothetical protein
MTKTIDSDFGLILNSGPITGPRRVLSTSADLYKNVQVHIPTKEELDEFDKRMSELLRKYCQIFKEN